MSLRRWRQPLEGANGRFHLAIGGSFLVGAHPPNLLEDFFHAAFLVHARDDDPMKFQFCLSSIRHFNPD